MMIANGHYRTIVVDDEPHIRGIVAHWLTGAGYDCTTAGDADEAWDMLVDGGADLVISDILMPGKSGMELLALVKERLPDTAVIMATAVGDRNTGIRALELGAYGYLIKPFDQNEMLINVAGALERRRLAIIGREYEHELEEQVRVRTAELHQREEAVMLHLLSAAELRDDETGAHVRRIGLLAAALAQALGWDARIAEDLRLAAPMHDVGKIGIPDLVLRKPGPLDPHESDAMQTHAILGGRILHDPEVPFLRLAADIARSHHEKWDGTGYPNGLAAEAIPAAGRLVAVVDVYDALTHDRVYRPAMSEDKALALMREGRGTHFDPEVFDRFVDCLPQLRAIAEEIPETQTN